MEIRRDKYLDDLVVRMGNGAIKVVTGIRRCGKTYLVFEIFARHLRESGVDAAHVIELALDDEANAAYRDPGELYRYVLDRIGDDGGAAYDFCVAVSEKQQEKLGFQIGDRARGTAWTPLYPREEFADLYRAGALKVVERAEADAPEMAVSTDGEPLYDGTHIPRVCSSDYPGPPRPTRTPSACSTR